MFDSGLGRLLTNWMSTVNKDLLKMENHLGGSRGGSSKQIRMASERVPMHLISCGLNQGQGCQTARIEYSQIDIGG